MQSTDDDRNLIQTMLAPRVLCGWNFSKRTVGIVNRVNDTRPNESICAQLLGETVAGQYYHERLMLSAE